MSLKYNLLYIFIDKLKKAFSQYFSIMAEDNQVLCP